MNSVEHPRAGSSADSDKLAVSLSNLIKEIDVETEALLAANSIDASPFTDEIIDSLPVDLQITDEILNGLDLSHAGRRDLRKTRIFTIDPPTARDLDDALHCTPLPNGNFEVGVHIADVTHFLLPDTRMNRLLYTSA